MPKNTKIKSILVIGSGPINIGQACEFDYSGTQALKALREEGYRVILINSNPATIMTDPELADATYIEPITIDYVTAVIKKERPDALIATLGGQTSLNCALALHECGVLAKYQVELIGASVKAITLAEDRTLFHQKIAEIGLDVPRSFFANDMDRALEILEELGLPLMVRSSFTLGGAGAALVHSREDAIAAFGQAFAQPGCQSISIDEFKTETAYLYSTYQEYCESTISTKAKIMLIGSGPNRIGQGIEFDYVCVKAIQAFAKAGYETIMVNCNPETVSTDYDMASKLYFIPLMKKS